MNPTASLGRHFIYNATYNILICKTCQYAVQKSALKSHLLRHQIYREDQKRLLSCLAKLTLLEPDDVELPPPGSSPVEHLAIFSGLRCTLLDCRHLCVSTKRMKHHWREEHSEVSCTESDMVAVSLQTFFRGTKVRYFEVTNQNPPDEKEGETVPVSTVSLGKQAPLISTIPKRRHTPNLESPTVNLDILKYFHHFITITCDTLPDNVDGNEKFWQKVAVSEGLQLQWLMFGILAISAHHLSSTSNGAIQQSDRIHALRYAQGFQEGWIPYKKQNQSEESQVYKSGARIACLLRCYHWSHGLLDISALSVGQRINLISENLQGCDDSTVHISEDEIITIEREAFLSPVHDYHIFSQETDPRNPREILNVIQSLPQGLALLLGKPKDIQDVHAILNAIALLSDITLHCVSAGEVNCAETIQWLHNVTNCFRVLLMDQNVAALVVLSCWLMIFEHIERGCWFLHGTSRLLRSLLQEALPSGPKVLDMVELFR